MDRHRHEAHVSARETAVAALAELLRQTGATVWRDTDRELDIPPEGLIIVGEGDPTETALLSPLRWEIDQACDIQAIVTAEDEHVRDAALNTLLASIAALIVADRTLAGAVQWAEPGSPSFNALEADGAAKVARFSITLSFVAEGTVLS